MARIRAMPAGPASWASASRLPMPMPCSPVQVPPRSSARRVSRSVNCLAAASSSGLSRVDQDQRVEVAVADVPDDDDREAQRRQVGRGGIDALGQARDRHAHVGRDHPAAGAAADGGEVQLVARVPDAVAVLGVRRPAEGAAAERVGDVAHRFGGSATAAALPWNSKNSVGASGPSSPACG